MKLESLVGLGINDIPTKFGRTTTTIQKIVPEYVKAQHKAFDRKLTILSFEAGDHTGIYTNKITTVESGIRGLASDEWLLTPPGTSGWHEASCNRYDEVYRYFDGQNWSESFITLNDLKVSLLHVNMQVVRDIQKGFRTKKNIYWRNTPLPTELLTVISELVSLGSPSVASPSPLPDVWNEGPPPKIGWYYASLLCFKNDKNYLRYWNGSAWSRGTSADMITEEINRTSCKLSKNDPILEVGKGEYSSPSNIIWLTKPIPDWLSSLPIT